MMVTGIVTPTIMIWNSENRILTYMGTTNICRITMVTADTRNSNGHQERGAVVLRRKLTGNSMRNISNGNESILNV